MPSRPQTKQTDERGPNALTLLRKDHKLVSALFEEFDKKATRGNTAAMKEIAEKVCAELTVHATIEEEIFYPGLYEAFPQHEDALDEAEVEHAGAKALIAKIQGGENKELFEAQVVVLGEYIRHHVKEEHELFAKIKNSRKIDFEALGARMKERKTELQQGRHMAKVKLRRKAATRRKAAKRELIDTGRDKRFVRRSKRGRFKESDDMGRSLSADRRRKAKKAAKPGQGDKGDRKITRKSKKRVRK